MLTGFLFWAKHTWRTHPIIIMDRVERAYCNNDAVYICSRVVTAVCLDRCMGSRGGSGGGGGGGGGAMIHMSRQPDLVWWSTAAISIDWPDEK